VTRQFVVAEAKSWLGTPYHHRGRLKGIGVDCAQFPLLVYAAAGLFEAFETGDYPPGWHLHRNEERYLAAVTARARAIGETDLQPGDFALFRIGRCFSHGAIVIAWPRLIHAVLGARVMEDLASAPALAGKPVKFFTPW
jgi:cell wall-associated NlpC family hydrolase